MIRETYVMRAGKLVPKREAAPLIDKRDARVHVISDTMAPMKHMATGKMHDSKSRFAADTKASGCVEVGNDPAARRERPRDLAPMHEVVMSVKQSLEQLRSR